MADENTHFWVEIENEELVMAGLTVYHGFMRHRQRQLLEELAKDGVSFLQKNVPEYTSYTQRHIDRSPVVEDADGDSETKVGIKRGTSLHPIYVNAGTGMYGTFKRPYTAFNPTGRMWFFSEKYGRVIGIESVKGQHAQHFLYTTFKELQVFAMARLTTGAY